jgi:tRNA/rRNA methyltransferase
MQVNIDILNNVSIILCNTSHNGNIGAVARAMKTMGLVHLVLVAPSVEIDDHSYAVATHAYDILSDTKIVTHLNEVISDKTLVYATTTRKREFNDTLTTPAKCKYEILAAINNGEKIAIVFGSEKSGLTIEQLEQCNRLVTIPGNPNYSSLNLAQAVQIFAYEIFSTLDTSIKHLSTKRNMATIDENQGVLMHITSLLNDSYYFNATNRHLTIRRLQNILHKASLDKEEINLIRGMLQLGNKKGT